MPESITAKHDFTELDELENRRATIMKRTPTKESACTTRLRWIMWWALQFVIFNYECWYFYFFGMMQWALDFESLMENRVTLDDVIDPTPVQE